MKNINISFGKQKTNDKLLVDFIYDFISKSKNLTNKNKASFRNLARHLKEFHEETGIKVRTNSFTETVAEEFIVHLKKKNLMLNTVVSLFFKVGTAIRRADKRGYDVDYSFESVKIKTEETNAVYLNEEELKKINELKNLSKEAKAVRDRFLLGCYTAMRFSDYSRITSSNIINNNIEIKTKKTGTIVIVPVHPMLFDILNRNNNDFPALPSQQSFNKMVKNICKRAGINEPVLYERTHGEKIIRKRLKKWEMVSSHTARRSGATNMYLAGISTMRIMLLTGHKTEQAFFKYIRINKEENAKTLSEHDFFKRKQ
jgi:integrase